MPGDGRTLPASSAGFPRHFQVLQLIRDLVPRGICEHKGQNNVLPKKTEFQATTGKTTLLWKLPEFLKPYLESCHRVCSADPLVGGKD